MTTLSDLHRLLCVALVIILIVWSALCIATMTQCIVHDSCGSIDKEGNGVEVARDIATGNNGILESRQIVQETESIVTMELVVRVWGIVVSIVLILSISTRYEC